MNQLVTATDVKKLTQVSPNADEEKLTKAVPDATTTYLRPLVGPVLLTALLAFAASAPTPPSLVGLNAADKAQALATYATDLATWRTAHAGNQLLALWDALKSCLAQWVLVEAWPDLLVHIDTAGIVQRTGNAQGTTSADLATLNQVHGSHRDRAVRRGAELVNWLELRRADYPDYPSTRPLATNARPSDSFGGIYV